MSGLAATLVALVALEHAWFLVLETVFWTKPLGRRTFRMTIERARDTAALAANQGLYNGFLAAGLLWSLVAGTPEQAFELKLFFLACVAVAGTFGAATVSRSILLVQAVPALAAILAVWLSHAR